MLTGPAGSGKTFRILERFRHALGRRDSGVRLLTPTATMAQHLQNRLAREGFVFRPGLIQTLSRFVDPFAADAPPVSEPLFYLIVEEAAHRVDRAEFARVVRLPGFCAALARTMEEFSAAGCDAERLGGCLPRQGEAAPLGEAFVAVYREVDRELRRRGLAMRSQRLLRAAERIAREGLPQFHSIWLDGFSTLPDPELAVIGAICRHADVTLTLPAAPITQPTRERLLEMGFVEEICAWQQPPPCIELCAAPSIEREADEIARRIVKHAAAGRALREMGVVVRNPDVYEPVLRPALDRFGIPARFYFDADLLRHAVVRFLAEIVNAMLGGWDHADTLAAVRLAPGIASDAFDFAVREQMPGAGLARLETISPEPVRDLLGKLKGLEEWRTLSLAPAEWVARLKDLRDWCMPPRREPGSQETAALGRGQAAALDLFGGAMEEAARALPAQRITLGEFWRAAKSVLRLTPLRVEDGRRNVVHVLGAHEARQWQLPVVFVCGLVEKQFPKYHSQDPFFSEAARAQLKRAGLRLRTAADFEAEERFLFDWAVTRATESLILSYPQFDARGQQNLRSLYLDDVPAAPVPWEAVRPRRECRSGAAPPRSIIASADLLDNLAGQHRVFRPTALESFLQCPFQFFGRDTLRLQGAPPRPEKRLDFRAQGRIAHAVLAELLRDPDALAKTFERIFRRICEQQHVPAGYRTESLRERMLADLRGLVEDPGWRLGYQSRTEADFSYPLGPGVEIKGRIDRIDVTPDGGAFVIDYKYSGAQNTKNRLSDETLLQPQLYLLALEPCFDLRPEGMSYWGFKGGIQRTPWTPLEPAHTIETTLRIAGEIRAGRVEPNPADPEKCRLCDYRDVCRFAAAAPALADGAAS